MLAKEEVELDGAQRGGLCRVGGAGSLMTGRLQEPTFRKRKWNVLIQLEGGVALGEKGVAQTEGGVALVETVADQMEGGVVLAEKAVAQL